MARLDTDLLGLQIVSKEDASLIGEVDALIIDDTTRRVVGFLVDLGVYEANVLAFDDATAIGADAVVVESARLLKPISKNPHLERLAKKDITITDAKAMTLSGRSVGVLGDFLVDTETGNIVAMEFIPSEVSIYPRETSFIPASAVHRLGREIVVLKDDYERQRLREPDSLTKLERPYDYGETVDGMPTEAVETGAEAPGQREPAAPTDLSVGTGPAGVTETEGLGEPAAEPVTGPAEPIEPEPVFIPDVEPPQPDIEGGESLPQAEPAAEEPPAGEIETIEVSAQELPAEQGEPADLSEDAFSSEQKHFLLGKRVLRRIEGPSGELIANEGELVTYEMIQRAKTSDMLLILSLNVE